MRRRPRFFETISARPFCYGPRDHYRIIIRGNKEAAAIPEPGYQWFRNGKLLRGATDRDLILKNVTAADAGIYTVMVKNASGSMRSSKAPLVVSG
jgi:hypothetical protein